jgi:hypothetical protein
LRKSSRTPSLARFAQANAEGLAWIVRSETDVELKSLAIEHLSRIGTVAAKRYLQEFAK